MIQRDWLHVAWHLSATLCWPAAFRLAFSAATSATRPQEHSGQPASFRICARGRFLALGALAFLTCPFCAARCTAAAMATSWTATPVRSQTMGPAGAPGLAKCSPNSRGGEGSPAKCFASPKARHCFRESTRSVAPSSTAGPSSRLPSASAPSATTTACGRTAAVRTGSVAGVQVTMASAQAAASAAEAPRAESQPHSSACTARFAARSSDRDTTSSSPSENNEAQNSATSAATTPVPKTASVLAPSALNSRTQSAAAAAVRTSVSRPSSASTASRRPVFCEKRSMAPCDGERPRAPLPGKPPATLTTQAAAPLT
mmetsp:Transcript_6236/g.18452  ORF Transcript_6236/g.18452 Transcript_6236/m.18452 type:complete len:315 (-) Transcript_6236:153-1097(-)